MSKYEVFDVCMLNNRYKLAGADMYAVCAVQLQALGLLRCLIMRGNCSVSVPLSCGKPSEPL